MDDMKTFVDPDALTVVIERTFDAPPELVWRVMNDPAMIPHYWGPAKYETIVEKMDFREGGEWRFVQRGPDGDEHGFHGVYTRIDAPREWGNTFNYKGIPSGHEMTETTVLENLGDGRTKLTNSGVFLTLEDMEGMAASGAESGARELYNRLEALLEKEMAGS
jgi:uncharacterized protein YndB with AHSA1/START domain